PTTATYPLSLHDALPISDLNLTINNTGGCTLSISGITSDSAAFTIAGTLSFPLTVHAGDSLAVPVRFHPSQFGSFAGKITVANRDRKSTRLNSSHDQISY